MGSYWPQGAANVIFHGTRAGLNKILKVESYHIARYLSADQFVPTFSFKGCNFIMELQKVSFFSLEGDV